MTKLAVIRLKGNIGLQRPVKDTFKLLRLYKVNYCAVLPKSANTIGMLNRIKDFATWGEIDEETFKALLTERGRLPANKPLTAEYVKDKAEISLEEFTTLFLEEKKTLKDIPGLKPFFRLKPPTGGFERKGVKRPYAQGGSAGYRRENINELIKKML